MQRKSGQEKIEFVQAMRGIASLLVLFWHGSRFFGTYGSGWAGALFAPGASMGVDLFFLISGFIMVATTTRCDGSASYATAFMIRRFARIWPVYVIATLLLIVSVSYRAQAYKSWTALWSLMQDLWFLPLRASGTTYPVIAFPALSVGWTLNYEMYFYAIFAVSLLFGRWRWAAFFSWLTLTLFAAPYFLSIAGPSLQPGVDYGFHGYFRLMTNPMIMIFAVGVVVGLLYVNKIKLGNSFWAGLSMFAALSWVVFQYCAGYRADHGISNWGLSLVPLFLFFCLASRTVSLTVPRVLVYLGDISFSLYLFHPLAQESFDRFVVFAGQGAMSRFASFFITSAVAIVLAALSHRYLELGLSNKFRDFMLSQLSRVSQRKSQSLKATISN